MCPRSSRQVVLMEGVLNALGGRLHLCLALSTSPKTYLTKKSKRGQHLVAFDQICFANFPTLDQICFG